MSDTTRMHREIQEQPAVVATLIERGQASAAAVAKRIAELDPDWVLMAARGSSENAARYAQYLFGVRNQLGVALARPSITTLYSSAPKLRRAVVIAISQSGESPDILAVVEDGRRQGALTVAVTNSPASRLAQISDHVIELHAGEERSVAATKTYTATLCALAMLSDHLGAAFGQASREAEFRSLPAHVEAALRSRTEAEAAARLVGLQTRVVALARGYDYATAHELALKLKETSYVMAEGHSAAGFVHGPIAMVDDRFAVALFSRAAEEDAQRAAAFRSRGAKVITFAEHAPVDGGAFVPLPAGVPEWLSPIVTAVSAQLFAERVAAHLGRDPDAPRGLTKVTRTR